MACDCLQKFDEKLKPQNLRVQVALFHSRAENRLLERPYLAAEPIEKKRGAKGATVYPTHCPFCGNAYEASETAATEGAAA